LGGTVYGDVADFHPLGRDHAFQLLQGALVELLLFLDPFLFFLFREIQHEGILPLEGVTDPAQQQDDNHREMYDRGDEKACFLVGG